jgi:hypothetical protein
MELKSLVDQPGKLPTIPKVVQQLMASFNSEKCPPTRSPSRSPPTRR